nr:2Fe-2S iron-sulfur cluster-binding protein [Haliscomenobacter sp.]
MANPIAAPALTPRRAAHSRLRDAHFCGRKRSITTIEGLSPMPITLQKAWLEEQVAQCGYCQSGQIMQAAALLNEKKKPSREEIISHMNGVLCRCGTYMRILKAIELAAKEI